MEDNNNLLIKVIAGTLILILALNAFRTETTKKQMDSLTVIVDSLKARVVVLENPDFSNIASEPFSNKDEKRIADLTRGLSLLQSKVVILQEKVNNNTSPADDLNATGSTSNYSGKEVSELAKSVSNLQSKVSSIQKTIDRMSSAQSQTASSKKSNTISSSKQSSESGKSAGRVSVTAKVKVEDRYAEKTVLPRVSNGPEGIVVVNVTIDPIGKVSSARIGSETTIKDEDILDQCKEAALKTDFNLNVYMSQKHPGTITYIFTAE